MGRNRREYHLERVNIAQTEIEKTSRPAAQAAAGSSPCGDGR
jgi:hypothetical protein